jgi:hypothetical protein
MMLGETEMVTRNLALTRQWLHSILEHPESLERLPDRAYIFDLPHDDPDLLSANLLLAVEVARDMMENGAEKRPIVLLPQ